MSHKTLCLTLAFIAATTLYTSSAFAEAKECTDLRVGLEKFCGAEKSTDIIDADVTGAECAAIAAELTAAGTPTEAEAIEFCTLLAFFESDPGCKDLKSGLCEICGGGDANSEVCKAIQAEPITDEECDAATLIAIAALAETPDDEAAATKYWTDICTAVLAP
jgi:hypothetical protein